MGQKFFRKTVSLLTWVYSLRSLSLVEGVDVYVLEEGFDQYRRRLGFSKDRKG